MTEELTDGRFGLATIEQGGAPVPAAVTEDGFVTLADLLGDGAASSVRALVQGDWDGWCDRIAAALQGHHAWRWTDTTGIDLAPPLPDPSNLYLAGANYWDHVKEMDAGTPDKTVDEPFHFMAPSVSLIGTGHDIVRPVGVTELDWEVELAVVIGHRAEAVSARDALAHVAGYAVANDISARGPSTFHPVFGLRFLHAKGQATLKPMGPVLVPARFVPDPGRLALSTHVNGEVRQDSSTEQMIWTVPEQIAYLSARAPLIPGDILMTGTPAGTAAAYGTYLADGDVVTSRVEGLGSLVNRVVARS